MNREFVPLWPIERRSYVRQYLLIKGGGRGSAFEEPPNFQAKSLVYCRIDWSISEKVKKKSKLRYFWWTLEFLFSIHYNHVNILKSAKYILQLRYHSWNYLVSIHFQWYYQKLNLMWSECGSVLSGLSSSIMDLYKHAYLPFSPLP